MVSECVTEKSSCDRHRIPAFVVKERFSIADQKLQVTDLGPVNRRIVNLIDNAGRNRCPNLAGSTVGGDDGLLVTPSPPRGNARRAECTAPVWAFEVIVVARECWTAKVAGAYAKIASTNCSWPAASQQARSNIHPCWKRGQAPIAASGPKGASHDWGLTPFPAGLRLAAEYRCPATQTERLSGQPSFSIPFLHRYRFTPGLVIPHQSSTTLRVDSLGDLRLGESCYSQQPLSLSS